MIANLQKRKGGGRRPGSSTEGCARGGGEGWRPPPPPPPPPPPLPFIANAPKPSIPPLPVPQTPPAPPPLPKSFKSPATQTPPILLDQKIIPPSPLRQISQSPLSQFKLPQPYIPPRPEGRNLLSGPPLLSKVPTPLAFLASQKDQESHPFRALDDKPNTVLRSNPLYTEEEEQEVVIIVDGLEDSTEGESVEGPRVPRRAPSTSSGYGSAGGSHGHSSPSLPKNDRFESERLSDPKNEGSQSTSEDASPDCTLSRSLKDDIRACLGGCRWETDVVNVVDAAVKGAGGITVARARLHAALLALQCDSPPLPKLPNRGPSLPYCGPGVRPGDVTMMPKNTEMSLLAASALFTLDSARGEALARRLARGERRRRRCRAVLSVMALVLLVLAVGAVELLLSRGHRLFGAVLR